MRRYQIWNRTDNLYPPAKGSADFLGYYTPGDVLNQWPWMNNPQAKAIITAGTINCGCFQEFEATKDSTLGRICNHIENKDQITSDHILVIFPTLAALDINWEDQTASAAAMAWWAAVNDNLVLEIMEWLEDNPLQITPPESLEATASERIAAALEYQNLLSMSDA